MLNIVPKHSLQPLESDASLEQVNYIFWSSLIDHVRDEYRKPLETILDIGCHQGGLLERLSPLFHPKNLLGVEPSAHCRERAMFRLRKLADSVIMLPPERWAEIPSKSVDLITCHEVLHLVEDLPHLFGEISRTLRRQGTAFIVAGCHTENPLWRRWGEQLQEEGQFVFDHAPFEILRAGNNAGLKGFLRPLRRDGWVIYNPDEARFKYSSVEELFNHQYRYKLLFRFIKQ